MDFTIRFENLETDIMTVSDTLNLNLDINLLTPPNEGVRDTDYTSYYNETTKDFVAQKYAEDIENFGYTF